jgi:hypothetical protein
MLRVITTTLLVSLLGIGSAVAQSSCAAKAVSKDGKPLAGAARTSAIKRCCEDSARSLPMAKSYRALQRPLT